jgi:hypothetical protein
MKWEKSAYVACMGVNGPMYNILFDKSEVKGQLEIPGLIVR